MVNLNRVVITGADSAIGKEISFGIKLSRSQCDVTKSEDINKLSSYNPEAILHLASCSIRACEANPLEAYKINVLALMNVANKASELNIPLIIISTGAIFNGPSTQEFTKDDAPNPQNIYGQTKYLAEEIARKITSKLLIIRTGWLFGFTHKKEGFTKFLDSSIDNLKKGESINATSDQKGSPTYISDFITTLSHLIESGEKGLVHVVNKGGASAFDIIEFLKDRTSSKSNIIATSMSSTQNTLKRSASEALVPSVDLRSWQDALEEYVS